MNLPFVSSCSLCYFALLSIERKITSSLSASCLCSLILNSVMLMCSCIPCFVTCTGGIVTCFYLKLPLPSRQVKHGSCGHELCRSDYAIEELAVPQPNDPLRVGSQFGGIQQYDLSLCVELFHRQGRSMAADFNILRSQTT